MHDYLLKNIDLKTWQIFKLVLAATQETARDVFLRAMRLYINKNAGKLSIGKAREWEEVKQLTSKRRNPKK